MIEVSGLTKNYGNVTALNDVSFSVKKGQIVGFLGANGAGKTTTMDILCGCAGADRGSAKICGFDITEEPIEAKRRLGYLPDVPPLYPDMRVDEYIEFSARIHRLESSKVHSQVSETIERLSLGEVKQRLVGNLSKGFRQRVALAQALVHDPEVLVLDEPTEGLDPAQIVLIRELIRSLAGKHTVILSSHILSEVQNICDDIIIIHQGKIVRQGSYNDLLHSIEGTNLYRLRVQKNAGNLVKQLGQISGIQNPSILETEENTSIEFAIPNSTPEGILDTVCQTVIQGGYGIRELSLKSKNLEDIFFQLTK